MQNYGRTKFRLIFKIIAIFLIQAFVVLDFAWAGALDLQINKISQKKSMAIFLSPKMQLDANTLQGVFLQVFNTAKPDSFAVKNKTREIPLQPIQPKRSSFRDRFRQIMAAALLFTTLIMPFASVNSAWTMGQQESSLLITETIPQELQALRYHLPKGVELSSKVETQSREGLIHTTFEEKGLNYENKEAQQKVAKINAAIDIIWQQEREKENFDIFIFGSSDSFEREDSKEAEVIQKAKILLKYFSPGVFKILNERKPLIYIAKIREPGRTVGSQMSGRMGKPIIYVNADYQDNTYQIAKILIREGITADKLPGGFIEYALKYNFFSFMKMLITNSAVLEEERLAYEAEKRLAEKIGIVLPNWTEVIDNSAISYRHDQSGKYVDYFFGIILFNFLPLIAFYYAGKNFLRYRRNKENNAAFETENEKEQLKSPSRRAFFSSLLKGAGVLTGVDVLSGISEATEREVVGTELKDLVIIFDKGTVQSEISKYIEVLKQKGLSEFYDLKPTKEGTVLSIIGYFNLNAEQVSVELNNLLEQKGLKKRFLLQNSQATWTNTAIYKEMSRVSKKVASISEELGFGEIDGSKLTELYEGITWVESKFKHWQKDLIGRVKPVKSYTNAIGVTQLIESQAVTQIVNWIFTHKGGLLHYADIMRELERIISKDYAESSESVYSDLQSFINSKDSADKRKYYADNIRRKILNNKDLIGVNVYYALAAWEFLSQRKKLGVRINDSLAQQISQPIKDSIESGPGSYKPESYETAKLQFNREFFRANLIFSVVGKELILSIINRYESSKDRYKALMSHFRSQIRVDKAFNQRLGYTYLTIMWDWARRLDLKKTAEGKFEFVEIDPQQQDFNLRKFDEMLAAAAAYNSGRGTVINALENFGNTTDKQGVPLWIKNMIGANRNNIREPINYIRMYLEDKFQNTGLLTKKNYIIHKNLIQERYKRIYIKKNALREYSQSTRQNGVRRYKEYKRKDSFDYNLAASLARILGSGYVDSYLLSYGIKTNRWETEIFYSGKPTFDLLAASRIDDPSSPHYAAGQELRSYLKKKGYESSLAALDNSIQQFSSAESLRIAQKKKIQDAREEELNQKKWAEIKYWGSHLGFAGVLTVLAGFFTALIIKRRIKLGAKPKKVKRQQRSSGAIKYKRNIPFRQKVKNTILRTGKGSARFFMFAFLTIMGIEFLDPLRSFAADGIALEAVDQISLLNAGILIVLVFLIYEFKKLQSMISNENNQSSTDASAVQVNPLLLSPQRENAGLEFLANHILNAGILKGQVFDNLTPRDKEIMEKLLFDDSGNMVKINETHKIYTAFRKLAQKYSDVEFRRLSAREVIMEIGKTVELDSELDKDKVVLIEQKGSSLNVLLNMSTDLGLSNKDNLFGALNVEQSI